MSISISRETSDESLEQEIRAQIKGHLYTVQLDSSLSQFRLHPTLRPFSTEQPIDITLEVKCTDGLVEVPAKASLIKDSENGAIYKLFGLSETQCQLLYNFFDNSVEGIEVSKEQLEADLAPPLDVRDFQLVEKNREVAAQAAEGSRIRPKQWLLSAFFLAVIGFFSWLLFTSLYNIVSEDWGQQEYYNHIASARYRVALEQLKEVDANLNFTRTMLAKMEDPEFKKDISPIQEQIFQRDLAAMEAHEAQMKEIVAVLKLNQSEVAKGNFFYERRVLDTFSTQDREASNTSSAQMLLK